MASLGGKNLKKGQTEIIGFPSELVPDDEAQFDSWIRQYVDAVISYGKLCYDFEDEELFRLAEGNVDTENLKQVMQLYTGSGSKKKRLPSEFRQVNVCTQIINRVIGKVDSKDLAYRAVVINEDAVSKKLEEMSAKVAEKLTRIARQNSQLEEVLGQPLYEEDEIPVEENIQETTLSTWQELNEINVSKGLKYLLKKKANYAKYKFNHQGFYNYVITGKMAFDTIIDLDDPNFYAIDPRNLIWDRDSASPFIQFGRFAGYYFAGTPQDIVDSCPELTNEQVQEIDSLKSEFSTGGINNVMDKWGVFVDNATDALYLNCYKVYIKALKKVRVKISPNKFDEDNPHVHFVDKNEKANAEKGEKIEERYINTVYECTKIGGKIYYQPRELPHQFVPNDSPSERTLPLVGIIDKIPSLIKLIKPLQIMRIQAFYHIERLMSQAKGKILIVDEAIDESGPENLYNMMAYSVYKINTAKEGEMQQFNGNSGFLAPKEVDLGLSNAVNDLMRLVAFIDQNIFMITGMNEPFQGIVKSDQGLGVTRAAVEQAQMTLQPYYENYYTLVEMVLQQLCNLMRPAWGGKEITKSFLGDEGFEFFNLTPAEEPELSWDMDHYGVTVENNAASNAKMDYMINMATQLLPISKDPEMALSIIKMINSSSAKEAESIFERGIVAMKKVAEAQQQMAMQQQQAQMQMNAQAEQIKAQNDQAKMQVKLQEQQMIQEGENYRTELKLKHNEDSQVVGYQNKIAEKMAEAELNQSAISNPGRPDLQQ